MITFGDAFVAYNLLFLNIIISAIALLAHPELIDRWGFRPYAVVRYKQWYRTITGGFLHGGFIHLLFNMLTLYSFGPYIESILGHLGFFILYFGSELAAHALTYLKYKNDSSYNAVGASGAISGVLMGFCLFHPFERLYVFFVPMPAILFAAVYIGYSIYASKSDQQGAWGNIAHEAHLGGALGGLLLTILLYPESILIFLSHFA